MPDDISFLIIPRVFTDLPEDDVTTRTGKIGLPRADADVAGRKRSNGLRTVKTPQVIQLE